MIRTKAPAKKKAAKPKAVKKPVVRTRKTPVRRVSRKTTNDQRPTTYDLRPTPLPVQEKVEDTKYYPGPVVQKFEERHEFLFPERYGDNKITLMVRDPYWLFAYWEINEKRSAEIVRELSQAVFSQSRLTLRVYNVDNWDSFDIEVTGGAKNWYLRVSSDASYCVDIGYKTPDGRFIAAARSNIVRTPLDRMSDIIDEQWMIPDWEKLYLLSGGFRVGASSGEVKELSSGSFVKEIGPRPFWLWVKTDVIVYGATEPSATVSVQGRKVNLRPDGTFSLRYELPEGKFYFPVEAVRDDGRERRNITPTVDRKTEPACQQAGSH
ncbi:MAG: DUF4912 domain-containing protein [Candidatus Margulisbacteria bacterium]|nr:DUF4912 domain-containing protein [Candidatus Margulisiibacteriota bacterium]